MSGARCDSTSRSVRSAPGRRRRRRHRPACLRLRVPAPRGSLWVSPWAETPPLRVPVPRGSRSGDVTWARIVRGGLARIERGRIPSRWARTARGGVDGVALGSHCASRSRVRTGSGPGIPLSGPAIYASRSRSRLAWGVRLLVWWQFPRARESSWARSPSHPAPLRPGSRDRRATREIMPLADVLAGHPTISTPALAGRVMIPRPGRSPRPGVAVRTRSAAGTGSPPPSVRPTRTSAPAPARGPARSRRRVGPRRHVRNHRPEDPHGRDDESGDNSAWGDLAEDHGHGDEPRPGEPRCAGATSDHPPPRPARLLRPFRSATPLHPSLYEEKGRSGGVRGVAERKRRSRG